MSRSSRIRKISYHIPFDIQSEIIRRLPVKSLLQFRSVSKQWKSFINSPEFINNYHKNHTNPQHHLCVWYERHYDHKYTSIIDNNTFPQQKFTLTVPDSLTLGLLRNTPTFNSVDGLLCFYGYADSKSEMVVMWNPTIRKSVAIVIPSPIAGYNVVGFGVCHDTNVPKLVKITLDKISSMWVVEVFTLSTRVWKPVYMGAPFKSCDLELFHVFVNGVIYFCSFDDDHGIVSNYVISFDLKNEMFGEVGLPKRLVDTPYLDMAKVNGSLGLLEYYDDGGMDVCGVWTRKDGVNKTFSKIYTVKVGDGGGNMLFNRVLEFRNNGEVVIELDDDCFLHCQLTEDHCYHFSTIEIYEPLSGHVSVAGIFGDRGTFSARSYTETLLLLDESDSVIH